MKELHNFLQNIVKSLQNKVTEEEKIAGLPKEIIEYTKGQLYEAGYILEIAEKIIYNEN